MSYNPAEDFDIKAVATQHGIDWRLLKALRQAENGSAGREFGVLAVSARTWTEQAEVAARTIRHTIGRYWQHVKADPWDDQVGAHTGDFLRYFSVGGPGYAGYAPLGADNDPTQLNDHHAANLLRLYGSACDG